jgi:hypothetical protein
VQVKAWARHNRINHPSNGTFNSYALTLMVLFHLQSVSPPIMPPMSSILFGMRPLQGGSQVGDAFPSTDVAQHCLNLREAGYGAANTQTTAELFLSFLVRFMAISQAWASGSAQLVRVSTFSGQLQDEPFDNDYIMLLEDPFDSADNAARTLGTWSSPMRGLQRVLSVLRQSSEVAMKIEGEECVTALVQSLFGKAAARSLDLSGGGKRADGYVAREVGQVQGKQRVEEGAAPFERAAPERPPLEGEAAKGAQQAKRKRRRKQKTKDGTARIKAGDNTAADGRGAERASTSAAKVPARYARNIEPGALSADRVAARGPRPEVAQSLPDAGGHNCLLCHPAPQGLCCSNRGIIRSQSRVGFGMGRRRLWVHGALCLHSGAELTRACARLAVQRRLLLLSCARCQGVPMWH